MLSHHSTKTSGTMEVRDHTFLASALDGHEWSASCSIHSTPTEYTLCSRALFRRLSGSGTSTNMVLLSSSLSRNKNHTLLWCADRDMSRKHMQSRYHLTELHMYYTHVRANAYESISMAVELFFQ